MREIELKGVVPDEATALQRLESAGAELTFAGRLEDRRYDDAAGRLAPRDLVLRLRTYREPDGRLRSAHLDWKGPTEYQDGYKVREELSSAVADPDVMAAILGRLGYTVIREIDRDVRQYTLGGATVRVERYPRMDVLAEVEGSPGAIEHAIARLQLPRTEFSAARLPDFVARYEARTGERAALCARELAGDFAYQTRDA
jgi:adenylate cyclase class IV